MLSDKARDPVCPVCAQSIPQGAALAFMRRDNLIHLKCLVAAQRRAEAPPSKLGVDIPPTLPRDEG